MFDRSCTEARPVGALSSGTGARDGRGVRICVAIATTGRCDIAMRTVRHLATLRDRPDSVMICAAGSDDFDLDRLGPMPFPLRFLLAPKGLCAQRNAVLDEVEEDTVLLFIDDDFLLHQGYITGLRALFATRPEVVMATGEVVADGILGPGYTHAEGRSMLPQSSASPAAPQVHEIYNGYGCNMAVRVSVVRAEGLRFDTSLPYYGWLEDVDFSRQLARFGQVVKHTGLIGVHLGTKTGRSRGVPLGYSQIANPVYLMRKGTMAPRRALRLMGRNVLANSARAAKPEPWVDRRGRLWGNLLAARDALLGRLDPERIVDL